MTNITDKEINRRKAVLGNWTYVLEKAITNLHKCLWFGIIEDLENSFEMLRYQTGLNVTIKHRNVNSEDYPKPSKVQREKLKALMPMDYYLYEYAKQLHEYRYKMFTRTQAKKTTTTNTLQRNSLAFTRSP